MTLTSKSTPISTPMESISDILQKKRFSQLYGLEDEEILKVPLKKKDDTPSPITPPDNYLKNTNCLISTLSKIDAFSPKSGSMYIWDSVITLFVLYNATFIPFRLGFNLDSGPAQVRIIPDLYSLFSVLDYIGDLFFLLDLVVRARLKYRDAGLWVSDTEKILVRYLSTWFLFDFFGSLPFDVIVWDSMKVHYCLRLTRLLRIPHIYKYYHNFEVRSTRASNYILLKLILSLLLISHWLACGYYGLAYYQGFGINSMMPPQEYQYMSLGFQYIAAYWWAVHVLTRFGGTVNDPVTILEMVFMTIVALFAFYWIAIVIGLVTEIIASLRSEDVKQRRHILSLKSFMKNKNLPKPLQKKIMMYFDHMWSKYKGWDEDEILSWLPNNFKAEVNIEMSMETIKSIPLFEEGESGYIKLLCSHLTSHVFTPGEWIIHEGETGCEMYIISRGEVDIYCDQHYIRTLKLGDYFGEIVLLLETFRTASVRSKTFCDTLVLSKQSLADVLKYYPHQRNKLIEMAEQRIALDLLRSLLKTRQEVFFSQFSTELCSRITEKFKSRTYKKGDIFYSSGDFVPSCFTFVGKGQLRILKNGKYIKTLKQGDFFTEDFLTFLIQRKKISKQNGEDTDSDEHMEPSEFLKYSMTSPHTLQVDSHNTILLFLLVSDFLKMLSIFPIEKTEFWRNLESSILRSNSVTSGHTLDKITKHVSSLLLQPKIEKNSSSQHREEAHMWLSKFEKLVENLPVIEELSPSDKIVSQQIFGQLNDWMLKNGLFNYSG